MNKFLAVLVAAVFAAVSFASVAAEPPMGDTSQAQTKKSTKHVKKSKKRSKKAATTK
mgnify:CR=1 FL=1